MMFQVVFLQLLVKGGESVKCQRDSCEFLAIANMYVLFVMQEVMREVIANVSEYPATKYGGCYVPIPVKDRVC